MYYTFLSWDAALHFVEDNPKAKIVGYEYNITKPIRVDCFIPIEHIRW